MACTWPPRYIFPTMGSDPLSSTTMRGAMQRREWYLSFESAISERWKDPLVLVERSRAAARGFIGVLLE